MFKMSINHSIYANLASDVFAVFRKAKTDRFLVQVLFFLKTANFFLIKNIKNSNLFAKTGNACYNSINISFKKRGT